MLTSTRTTGTRYSDSQGEAINSFLKNVRSKIGNMDSDMNPVDRCHQLKMWVSRSLLPFFFISFKFRDNVNTVRTCKKSHAQENFNALVHSVHLSVN